MAIVGNLFLKMLPAPSEGACLKRYLPIKPSFQDADMSKRVLSEKKQKESNERMRLATIYAKYMYKTDEGKIKARIRLKLPAHKSLFHAW